MNTAELLPALHADGVTLFVTEQGALRYRGDQAVVARWLPQIKQHKPELIGLLPQAEPESPIERLERQCAESYRKVQAALRDASIRANAEAIGNALESSLIEGSEALAKIQPDSGPPPLSADDRDAIHEAIEERAAILEFDAGMERRQAEIAAQSAMRVFQALVTLPDGSSPRWITLLAPGCDLVEARQTLAHQFGPERVLEVIEHQAEGGAA